MENLLNSRKQAVREDGKVIQLIQGRIAPRQGYPDLYRLAPCKMRLMCRYGLNMEGFGPLDKFLVRAEISNLPLETHKAIYSLTLA
jgi:hypothetical protein